MNCNYKVNVKDIQDKYNFKIFSCGSYDDSEIKKMYEAIYMALPKEKANGTSITLNDTAKSFMMNELNATENSQYTTTGNNIFKPSQFSNSVIYQDDIYTFHRDTGADYLITSGKLNLKPSTAYTMLIDIKENTMTSAFSSIASSFFNSSFAIGTGATGKFYINTTTKDSAVTYDLWLYCPSTGTLKAKIMLVEGTYTSENFPEYEPYTNGASPNLDYPQVIHTINGDNKIVSNNRNLWDEQWEIGGIAWTTGQNSSETDRIRSKNYIRVNGNTLYNFTSLTSSAKYVWCYDKDKNIIPNVSGGNNFIQLSTSASVTFTTPLNCYYIRFIMWTTYGTTYNNDICINYSDSDNGTYTKHQGNSVLLTLGDKEICKIGNYEDKIFKAIKGNEIYDSLSDVEKASLDYGKWYLRKAIGKYTFTGNETLVDYGVKGAKKITDMISGLSYSSNVIPLGYSNISLLKSRASIFETTQEGISYNNTEIFTYFANKTQQEILDLLENNDLYYILATPTNEKFNDTIQEQLEDIYYNMLSYEGQTNIFQINDDLPFNITSTALKDLSSLGE